MVKDGWTDKLNSAIQKELHLPCVLAFRRVRVRSNDIAMSGGYCREKLCAIKISSSLPHNSTLLTITIEGFDPNVIHNVHPRRIAKDERPILLEKLKGQSAYAVRSEIANAMLTDENSNPNKLPTNNALRVMKSKEQIPNVAQNAVISMYDLLKVHPNCIQRIELLPFATHYSLPSQISWYRVEFSGKTRSVISVDATGLGLVSPTDLRKHIFLYVICAQGNIYVMHINT